MVRRGAVELGPESILFADDDLVAVDKAAGLLCDATIDPAREHLGTALQVWAATRGEPADFFPAHRLDRPTSGVVVFARTREAATTLMEEFRGRTVTKIYQAIVVAPAGGTWQVGTAFERRSHLRHRGGRTVEVRSGGKPAVTGFRIDAVAGDLALVRALPETGRTHQIRVHLAALGAPIHGDELYRSTSPATPRSDAAGRLWLHAAALSFSHPRSHDRLDVRSRTTLALGPGGPHETRV